MSDLVERLRKRAEIRRALRDATNGKRDAGPDRIADLLDEAANALETLQASVNNLSREPGVNPELLHREISEALDEIE